MRKLLLLAAIGIASLTAAAPAKAQVSLSINIGSQPQWGPRGYNHVDYYYLPDVESYYYVPTRQFVYLSGGRWIHSHSLPSRYRGYDLYGGRKVVINGRDPWLRHEGYRTQYVRNSYRGPSRVIYRGGGYSRGGYNRGYDRGHGRPDYNHGNNGNHGNWNNGNHGGNNGNHGGDHGNGGNHGGGHGNGGDHGGRGGRGRG